MISHRRRRRLKRMKEMKENSSKRVFGSMLEISQTEFVAQVSEASKSHWVVVFLYKLAYFHYLDFWLNLRIPACKLLANHLNVLAAKYPETKFVSIIGDHCIPNYPDSILPTWVIYGEGDLIRQQIGLLGLGGLNTRVEDVEMFLVSLGAVQISERDKKVLISKIKSLFTREGTENEAYDSD